ncbi:hypothetical protein NUW54_g2997 [Trametes sanguinea]|uniref:Uncharacterized protein n=1 Tax=Trametes sanguinea TaxID=158606 RepID=A0ACC1Q4U3_9APHY|nr:hypothetical protein NUW54_g2997 [Trametes sanguinea]
MTNAGLARPTSTSSRRWMSMHDDVASTLRHPVSCHAIEIHREASAFPIGNHLFHRTLKRSSSAVTRPTDRLYGLRPLEIVLEKNAQASREPHQGVEPSS